MELPSQLSEKAAQFPESSYGATTVTLLLKNDKKVENVVLAWGAEIVKINNVPIEKLPSLGFESSDIVDVLPDIWGQSKNYRIFGVRVKTINTVMVSH